jgi:GH15 family glucan-1,4-alpha-glucosidase
VARTPIADYALLSDCHSAALVSKEGSVDWLCFPRFDSPSVFGRLLDSDAGHWSIGPVEDARVTRRYRERTMVLETTFETPAGRATLVDAMATGPSEGHALGRSAPHALLRRIACERGQVEVRLEYGPVPEYGLVYPLFSAVDGGLRARAGADVLALSSPVELRIERTEAVATFNLREGEYASFALHRRASWEEEPKLWSQDQIDAMVEETTDAWRKWSREHQNYDGPWRELVYHSGCVLQALTYQPTGAIVAAPTTSLPETVGGVRNWDYRFAWVRDASFTLEALWVAACPDEVRDFFDWMSGAAAAEVHRGAALQIVFGVGGEHDITERELPHLGGWRDSRPVRVGNGAWTQNQLDVYGEVLSAAHRLVDRLGDIDPVSAHFLADIADAAARRWEEPGHGIWEIRGEPRLYLSGRLLCWVALDRAIALADRIGAKDRVASWKATREEIRTAILERAWSEKLEAFAQAFDSDDLDASALLIPIVGFLPPDDPRVLSTMEAIERDLVGESGLAYRYLADDHLPGDEGAFLLCTFWLAHALALAGRTGRAREVFERAAAAVNDVGLLAEEIHEETGEFLGNFPQAFSHIGLINAAWAITQAERPG